jgi:hypothetical protein
MEKDMTTILLEEAQDVTHGVQATVMVLEKKKKQKIKENVKKAASSIGRMAVRSALLGATVAAKVVFNTAITSLTIAGIAAAGFQALNSPEVQTLLTSIGIRAGQWFVDTYVRQGANVAQANIDYLMSVGEEYLETL